MILLNLYLAQNFAPQVQNISSFLLSMQAIAKMLFMTFVFLQITNSQKLSVCENTQARNKERMPLGL